MPKYFIRVELHNGSPTSYDELQEKMLVRKYSPTYFQDQRPLRLPGGCYWREVGQRISLQVQVEIETILSSIGFPIWNPDTPEDARSSSLVVVNGEVSVRGLKNA